MAFSPICSVVYALGLVRLISRCYVVPQFSTMHPNRCLLVPGLPIPFGFPFILACPVLVCITLFYWPSLCSFRATVRILSPFRLRHVIGLPSSPIILVGFLVTSVVSFDMLLVIAGYLLNFP